MRLLNDLSIRVKVLIISMLLLPALVGVSGLATYGTLKQAVALRRAQDIALNRLVPIDRFVLLSEQVQSDVFRISVLRSMGLPPEEREPVQARLGQGLSDLNVIYGEMLVRWELDAPERAILERMKDPMDAFRSQAQQAALVVRDNPSYGVLLVRSTAAAYAEFRRILTELHDHQAAKIIRIAADSGREARTIRTTVVALAALISLVVCLAAGLLGARLISTPIAAMTGLMHRLAEGDLSVAVAGRQRRDEIGDIARAVEVFRDDAIRKAQVEEQLRQAQKMETVGQLAGGVAHSFNNMLQVIISYVEMSLGKVEEGQPVQKYLLEVRKAAQRSAELTGQLLAFARKQMVSPKVLDLNDALAGAQKMIQRLIGEEIDLAWMPGRELWKVRIDPAQVDQMLSNLADNARDAIGGVGTLTIETENVTFDQAYCATHAGSASGEYVLLAVSDTGCGMDEETMSHLFEPFFTTKGQGKGTGLGLATIYGIVGQNDGYIEAYSEPGQGTTFKVYLPRAE